MAFMVPLVKNHYDIYARNNPADHHNGNNGGTNGTGITGKSGNLVHDPASNSLILSATSLGKSGAPVKKQYRIILSGGQVVTNGNNGGKKKVPGNAGANFVTANGKAYYRMPSASISLPVNGRGPRPGGPGGASRRSSKSTSEAGGADSVRSTPTSPEHRSNSSNGSSPGSPPHYPSSRPPHSSASASICQQPTSGSFRRTSAGVRSPQSGGNRLYSYSVSIPEDEEKKVKESLNSLLADKENLVDQESQLEDDHQLLAIFATSAPGGTGALEEASLVKPPPSLKMMKKKMVKKPLVQKSASLNAASPPPLVETKVHSISPSSPPASPTSSPPASPSPSPSPSPPPPITTTSREYVELLRKFILHLKMLKIGSNNNNNNSSSKQRKQSKKSSVKSVKSNGVDKEESELSAAAVADAAVEVGSSEVSSEDSTSAPKRARKRKDTMEDSKDL